MFLTQKLSNKQRNPQNALNRNQKQINQYLALSQQQLHCQKQVQRLYGKLSATVHHGQMLQQQKLQLQQNKLHLSSIANESGRDLSTQLITLRQTYKLTQQSYASLKSSLINNSLQIKKTNKQINQLRQSISQRELVYSQMKEQTQKLKQKQQNCILGLHQIQQQLKVQSLKKIELIRIESPSLKSSKLDQVLDKIREMQEINSILNEILAI